MAFLKSRRGVRLLAAAVTVVVVLGLAAYFFLRRGGDEPAGADLIWPDEVRIAFQTIPNGEAIVRHQGWLEDTLAREHGTTVRWVNFASGSDVNAALAAGDIDIGLIGSTLFATGVERGVPYKLIWIHDVIGDNEALIVRADAGIDDVADLAGKAVATPFGSTTHYTLLSAIRDAGLTPGQVRLLDMKPQDIAAAWVRGDIDAAYVWEPTLSMLVGDGGRVLLSSADLVERGVVTADLGVAQSTFLERYPHVVEMYLAAQVRAVRLIQEDPEEAARIVGDLFDLPAEEMFQQMTTLVFVDGCGQLSQRWLGGDIVPVIEDTAAFLHGQGLLSSTPTRDAVAAAVDVTPLAQVAGECPIDG